MSVPVSRPAFLASLFLVLPALAAAQTKSLADFLRTKPVAGSWIAIAPESVTKEGANDLAGFDRKAVRVGGLTAVVPTTMTLIDDRFTKEPDLYDGLPRSSKILALMASLNADQWRLISGAGLGLNDLSGEPRKIFLSLLPRPFNWKRHHVRDGMLYTRETESLTLEAREVDRVRLRLNREITLRVHQIGQRGVTGMSEG